MYKFVKRLFVAVLIVIAACFALKSERRLRTLPKVVDFVGTLHSELNGKGIGKVRDLIKNSTLTKRSCSGPGGSEQDCRTNRPKARRMA